MKAAVAITSLLSGSVALQLKDSSCACLNWKSLYASKTVNCHASPGFEYWNEISKGLNASTYDFMEEHPNSRKEARCSTFLEKLDDNFCVNQMFEDPTANEKWCYVSASCSNLQGGGSVNDAVSTKFCDESEYIKAKTKEDYEALVERNGMKYRPGRYPDTTEVMYMAKFTMDTKDFNVFYAQNCDPLEEPQWCKREMTEPNPASSSCECLNWKGVYATTANRINCHNSRGDEYFTEIQQKMPIWYYDLQEEQTPFKEGRCSTFLEKIDDNFCVNQQFESNNTKKWCFVSSGCANRNGGKLVNHAVSTKICEKSEYVKASTKADYEALLAKHDISYPSWRTPGTPAWMYMAKYTQDPADFNKLWLQTCDPVKEAMWGCTRQA